jgi:hypothetical protein
MRTVLNIAVLVLSFETFLGASPNATNIRRVDFKNFSYAWSEEMGDSSSVPSLYRCITPPSVNIRVANGIHHYYPRNRDALEGIYPLIRVNSVTYGDLQGDGAEEAAVHLNYSTGGTSNWDFLYLYRLRDNVPKLFAILQSGSRGSGGLVRVSMTNGILALDFADEERRLGDCCP